MQHQHQSKLLSLTQASRHSQYSPEYLNVLVRRGKLPAQKIGRNWHTSKAALAWYEHQQQIQRSTSPEHFHAGTHIAHPVAARPHPSEAESHPYIRLLILLFAGLLLLFLLFPEIVLGMSSPNYRLNQDFIGSGGTRETSTNFTLIETIGDVGTGNSQSTNFRLRAGYLSNTEDSSLTFTISQTSLDLGLLDTLNVKTASHTMTVTTHLTRGYAITAQANNTLVSGANQIPFVGDGTVTAGTAEYGAAFAGGLASHPAGDIALNALTTVSQYSDNVSGGDTTTATYKAAVDSSVPSGTYASTTTYIATATF